MGFGAIETVAMDVQVVLAETLAMIGDNDHERMLQKRP